MLGMDTSRKGPLFPLEQWLALLISRFMDGGDWRGGRGGRFRSRGGFRGRDM